MKILSTASPKQPILTVALGASPEHCEDGTPIAYSNGAQILMAVFDGVGGRQGGAEASAIASATISEMLKHRDLASHRWFAELQQQITERLQQHSATLPVSKIRRKNNRRLCTTLACVHAQPKSHSANLRIGWIGDSRIYWLDPKHGLQQMTRDDLVSPVDAFDLTWHDQPMSQVLSADMEQAWHIHYWEGNIPSTQGFLIACTDGAFQHLQTPWYIELFWLQSLIKAASWEEWQTLLLEHYEHYRNDDVTLLITPIGFKNIAKVKQSFQARYEFLSQTFITQEGTEPSYATLQQQWAAYRIGYEALLLSPEQNSPHEDLANAPPQITELSSLEPVKPQKKLTIRKYKAILRLMWQKLKRHFKAHKFLTHGKL